jgi:hypothetical protein
LRTSILKSLKPDIIVEMLEMAVAFENWKKGWRRRIFCTNVYSVSMKNGSIIKQ